MSDFIDERLAKAEARTPRLVRALDETKATKEVVRVGDHEIELFETRYSFEIKVIDHEQGDKEIMSAVGGHDDLPTVIALMEDAIRG